MPVEEQRNEGEARPHVEAPLRTASRPLSGTARDVSVPSIDARTASLIHALRCLHLLFRSERL